MAFFSSTVPKYYHNRATNDHPFMTCVVRVNTQSQWQRTVTKVLDKCCGVHSFRMDDNGVIEIAGTVDPSLLLKMLGKAGRSAELCWFQFGQCSSNLFMQPSPGESYSRDGRFLHATNLSRPKLPSQQALSNQSYAGYYDHDNQYYSYGNELGHYHGTDHYSYGNEHGHYHGTDHRNSSDYHDQYYSYGNEQGYYPQSSRYQIQTRSTLPYRSGEDIGCCTIM